MPKILHRYCPHCYTDNSDALPLIVNQPEWPLKKCRKCEFVYLERVVAYEEFKINSAWNAQLEKENTKESIVRSVGGTIKKFRKAFKRDKLPRLVDRYIKSGTIIDVGCGEGDVLARLSSNYAKVGIEISETLVAKAKYRLPCAQIIHGDAISGMKQLCDPQCRGIIMSAFLDHEIEPRLILQEAYDAMAVGAVVIIKVQNYNCLSRKIRGSSWRGFRFPERVNYFTPTSLASMVRSIGLVLRRFRYADRCIANDNMWLVIEKPAQPLLPRVSVDLRRRCTRLEWS